ncbi:MAG: 4-hydroxy-tetrahydrodipicolinate synthase [Nitrospirota bacterium]|nr:4-hydroxy-tetrahydrodipicolinate synthase [Nitrospirota bacterium]
MFRGSIVALVTPFDAEGVLDEQALARLVEWHVEQGTHGIVPCGTTGESATLTFEEHQRVVEVVVEAAARRLKVIAGSGSNSTAEAIDLTRHARAAGADAALLITPYYNKPTQEGLYRHHAAIARAVDIPQILYNVPGRTVVNMQPETVERLAAFDNIVAIKEATGSIAATGEIIRRCGERMAVISGDDFSNLGLLAMGAVGWISVTANIIPADLSAMYRAWEAGDLARARELHYAMIELHNAMFIETSPIPVKTALAIMGRVEHSLRLPLCDLSPASLKSLRAAMADYGLLKECTA